MPKTKDPCQGPGVLEVYNEKSEDISVVVDKENKYLKARSQISGVIESSKNNNKLLIDEIAREIIKLTGSWSIKDVVTLGISHYLKIYKKKKLGAVLETILKKIFDVTIGWYVLDYRDLQDICDTIGGKSLFDKEDHLEIYKNIVQILEVGPLREECIQIGLVDFLNEKLIDVRENYLIFKRDIY